MKLRKHAKRSIPQTMIIIMLLMMTVNISIIGGLWIIQESVGYDREASMSRERYLSTRKNEMKQLVDNTVAYVEYKRRQTDLRTRQIIKERVYEAHAIASHIFDQYRTEKNQAEIQDMVREALRPIRFSNGRGYFFATKLDGVEELFADRPEMEGKNLLSMQDTGGAYIIQDMIALVREYEESYYSYSWTKPGEPGGDHLKLSFIKYFAPFDWFIGTGEYLADVEQDLQQEALDWIDQISYGDDGYVFAGRWDGTSLAGPTSSVGTNMIDATDPNSVKIVAELIENAKAGGGFVNYVMPRLGNQRPEPKISYAKGVSAWGWYIGTGLYVDDIEQAIAILRTEYLGLLQRNAAIICILLGLLWMGAFLTVRRMAGKIRRSFTTFATFFVEASAGSARVSTVDLGYHEFEELAESANRMIVLRKAAEHALRESEERFRLLSENAPDVIYRMSLPDGRYEYVSPASTTIMGYTPEEYADTPLLIRKAIHHDWLGYFDQQWEKLRQGQMPDTYEYQFVHGRTGETRWLHQRNVLITDVAGNPTAIVGMVADFTESKQAEEALRESEIKYRILWESSGDGFAMLDGEKYIDCNEKALQIFGCTKERLMGSTPFDFSPVTQPDGRDSRDAGTERLRETLKGASQIFEWLHLRPDGTTIDTEIRLSRVNLGDKEYVQVSLRDITERKHAEVQLYQAAKLASLGTLVSGVAHEINNPNNFIRLSAENLSEFWNDIKNLLDRENQRESVFFLKGIPYESAKDMIERMLKGLMEGSRRIENLIVNLKEYARRDDGDLNQAVNVNEVIKSAIPIINNLIRKSTDTFSPGYEKNLPSIRGNYHQIEQVIMNLLTNACQALTDRKQGVTITTKSELDSDWVTVEVRDEGAGIPEEDLPRITDPFFTTKRDSGGTGLGLSVSYRIIENHGGTLTIQSVPGEGTTACIQLPVGEIR
jgi:PAS domain S-box-containing protein